MTGFIFRRLLQSIVLIKFVLVFVFLLLHLTGDPVRVMAPDGATEQDIEQLRHEMGLDKPLLTQYGIFFWGAIKGDFGVSFEHAPICNT